LCVLLTCFDSANQAAKLRRPLGKKVTDAGGTVLDQVVLRVRAKRKALVYDPHRVRAGTLTAALTWGLFGLLSGGVPGLGIWAILGAVCGGLFAYYSEHLATKDELRRLGQHLPKGSSAILAFVRASSGERLLSSVVACSPKEASVAAIGGDFSARVMAGASDPVQSSSVPAGGGPVPPDRAGMLNMLLMRYRGKDTARRSAAMVRPAPGGHEDSVQPELLIEVPEHGRAKVIAPTQLGARAFAKSDTISWGLFGLVYGAIVGAVSNNGALGAVETGVVTALAWAAFGLAAGALYGLWAGRAVSARRLRGLAPLLPQGSSTLVAWSEENLTDETVERWSQPGADWLILRFNQVSDGALLEV
jgi:uncharacterized membrane protein